MTSPPKRVKLNKENPRRARQVSGEEFQLDDAERDLATRILDKKPNLWVFRPSQKESAGDFLVVDMSGKHRGADGNLKTRVWGFEYKDDGGAAGNQLAKLDAAVTQGLGLKPPRNVDQRRIQGTSAEEIFKALGVPPSPQEFT